ncbi:MAG: hypothetical protein JXX14_14040, partial [Deltaproteobacteria bacterium]|nr:hypothetical protein [Deltaproteobacteria bacterium]
AAVAGSTVTASAEVPVSGGSHSIIIVVQNSSGVVLAQTSVSFTTVDAATIPLAVIRQTPENQARGVEVNQPITLVFNREFDPALLEVAVTETVHGKAYDIPEGVDLREQSNVKLVEVHLDNAPVAGGLSYLPGNKMIAFYGDKGVHYGAKVYVEVTYDGQSLYRSYFEARPLPTLVQGFVCDGSFVPIQGIKVTVPELGLSAITDGNGSFGFGYGEPVEKTIPPGRYLMIYNPNNEAPGISSVHNWLTVMPEIENSAGMIPLPFIETERPYEDIRSGDVMTVHDGLLELDMTNARLVFPDSNDRGAVHVQMLQMSQFAYAPIKGFETAFVFQFQPAGIRVDGKPVVKMNLRPDKEGEYTYLDAMNDWVMFVGVSNESLRLSPVGVGHLDRDKKQIISKGRLAMERLEYVGIAMVSPEKQPLLETYANGEMNLQELLSELSK